MTLVTAANESRSHYIEEIKTDLSNLRGLKIIVGVRGIWFEVVVEMYRG